MGKINFTNNIENEKPILDELVGVVETYTDGSQYEMIDVKNYVDNLKAAGGITFTHGVQMKEVRKKKIKIGMPLYSKALQFGRLKHEGQLDDTGGDYFTNHCLQVASILEEVCPEDENLVCAGILHDTLEDTQTTLEELKTEFNIDIASLVHEVTHDGQKDHIGYYFPRLSSKRGIILKFADRLSNLSRMSCWDAAKQEYYLKKSKFWKSNI